MTRVEDLNAFKDKGDVIWNIANLLRGPYRPPQYRRVMIPLTVLRRLDCVLEATKDKVIAMHEKLKAEVKSDGTAKYDAETIEKIINQKFKLTFHNTSEFTFQNLLGDPDKLAANLANFMAGFSSRARKIIEKFKFEEEMVVRHSMVLNDTPVAMFFAVFKTLFSSKKHAPIFLEQNKKIKGAGRHYKHKTGNFANSRTCFQ